MNNLARSLVADSLGGPIWSGFGSGLERMLVGGLRLVVGDDSSSEGVRTLDIRSEAIEMTAEIDNMFAEGEFGRRIELMRERLPIEFLAVTGVLSPEMAFESTLTIWMGLEGSHKTDFAAALVIHRHTPPWQWHAPLTIVRYAVEPRVELLPDLHHG